MMKNCSICGSANLNEFQHVAEPIAHSPTLSSTRITHAWWCEDCGTMHTDSGAACPEKSMLHHQVLAFHKRFGQVIGEKPHVPDRKTLQFRLSLVAEEFFEMLEACGVGVGGAARDRVQDYIAEAPLINDVDLPALVDALADIDYVIEGFRITLGVQGQPIADEVQRANMAKLPSYVAAKDATHGKAPGNVFHDHLDVCAQCREHPHDLCAEGALKLKQATEDAVRDISPAIPVKREDGKILKPPGWTPPDIEGELRKQGWEP